MNQIISNTTKIKNCLNSIAFRFRDWGTLWVEADEAVLNKNPEYAYSIYRHLSRRKPKQSLNFLRAALSEYRLQKPAVALDILESGIGLHPGAEYLREHHLLICTELGQIERAIELRCPGIESITYVGEKLFSASSLEFGGSSSRVGFIEYCYKRGFYELAERGSLFIKSNYDNAVTLWSLSDLYSAHGRSVDAEEIYKLLRGRKVEDEIDCFYASMSEFRLGNIVACLDFLESGQRKFPDSDLLSGIYLQICAGQLEADRYRDFATNFGVKGAEAPQSNLSFYRMAIRKDDAESFILRLKDLELKLTPEEFNFLKEEFLASLVEQSITLQKAKSILFYCNYFDIDPDFTLRLYSVLKDNPEFKNEGGDSARYVLRLLYELTAPIIPQVSTDADLTVQEFIRACYSVEKIAVELNNPITDMTKDWTPWICIFCLVAPTQYSKALSAFEKVVFKTWPRLDQVAPHVNQSVYSLDKLNRKLRIGFIVHDSMPMISGFLNHFDKDVFETIFLRPGSAGKSTAAQNWVARADKVIEYSDVDTYAAIDAIAAQQLDIIISGPSIASVFYPLMARLASLQMVLLEPNWTDGLANTDYYISWEMAEPASPADFYRTSVSYLRNPPYWIERPAVQSNVHITASLRTETRHRLLGVGPESRTYLCANTPPKIHPEMDEIFYTLLKRDSSAKIVLLRGEYPPAKTLKVRLHEKLGSDFERIIFLPTLSRDDAHLLLQSVDCCIDSYPLCGMSSSFDGAMLGVPTVTLPAPIPFGRWTAAIYEYIGVSGLTAIDKDDYVNIAIRLASDNAWHEEKSREIASKASRYVESMESSKEFQEFIIQAWNRKAAGLPSADWISGEWNQRPVQGAVTSSETTS